MFKNLNIVIGITGGIASYKACGIVNFLKKEGANIEVKHISIAQKADVFLIIPATANIIGKIANGIADDMLTTTIMATTSPVIFVPAMNNKMYENKIVQNNIEKLKQYGYKIIEPSIGSLACGYEAKGHLPKKEEIIEYVKILVKEKK